MAEYYTPPPSSGYQPEQKNSSNAVISIVAGILGIFIPIIASVVAVITGHMAKREIRASAGTLSGDGLATAGLILGYAGLVIWLCVICGIIGFFSFAASNAFVFEEAFREFELILP
jgi:hypothetical protein